MKENEQTSVLILPVARQIGTESGYTGTWPWLTGQAVQACLPRTQAPTPYKYVAMHTRTEVGRPVGTTSRLGPSPSRWNRSM
ncbi:hypothetical protein PLICRDRAFT_43061 [Plicaturopsis crispa FD-325 SS-3]|nr:hypothetical protein PLICRDRAFT_43061 [Plicaturopsis crispa FD-325 SS-3]